MKYSIYRLSPKENNLYLNIYIILNKSDYIIYSNLE